MILFGSIGCVRSTQYMGKVAATHSHKTCDQWSFYTYSSFPDGSARKARNYCRDPSNSGYLWCYTTDPDTKWESCNPGICASNNKG